MFFNLLEGETNTGTNSPWVTIIFIGIIVLMIGLLVWQTISGKKKQKETQNMLNQLKIGDRVKTIGGVCGFIVEMNEAENTFVLETGTDDKKSYVKFDKGAIYQTAPAQGSAVAQAEQSAEEQAQESAEPFAETAETEEPAAETPAKKPRRKKSEE